MKENKENTGITAKILIFIVVVLLLFSLSAYLFNELAKDKRQKIQN